ncbi:MULTISPECIES: recombinase family protein [unclassified Bradyrhizobium]|uniref:recombinase family protein n=1 Tax=unclassified Bradyrhizobium TaxID=2631580 RepID=UPI0029162ECC|nr:MULTISPECIES: recombinase family protein [unclassified Bradyrhizobium]
MVNALVVHETHLPKAQKGRAAQYVRMSTDYQRYSAQNQAAVIAAYAHAHEFSIVRTYADHGESGLRIKNRAGLTQLIQDITTGKADFDHVLVYDVSRWGRFQDTDESAHYEFLCKQAGIKVAYCAEQFDNDGSMLSNIMKNLKRVMAAEYSRELSVKVHAGICRYVSLGFQPGGPVSYGLQRVLVDEKLEPKTVLVTGDRKYLRTDHVRLEPGDSKEVAVVRWIFHRFLQVRSLKAVAAELNEHGVPRRSGKRWRGSSIGRIVRNENYLGNIVYNRHSRKLRGVKVRNPQSQWIKSENCFDPIVEPEVFLKVQKILAECRIDISQEEMLSRLRQTLKREGRLSPKIINSTPGLPSSKTYVYHFGSLRKAYRLVGYDSTRNCDFIESRQFWAERLSQFSSRIITELEGLCEVANFDPIRKRLRVNGIIDFYFKIARWHRPAKTSFSPQWAVQCRRLPAGWIVAIRLCEDNTAALDYLLLPTRPANSNMIRFGEKHLARHNIRRFKTVEALTRAMARRITGTDRASPATRKGRSKRAKQARSKRSAGHERC